MKREIGTTLLLLVALLQAGGQTYRTQAQRLVMTNEDSLQGGASKNKTVISGYGSASYQRDFNQRLSIVSLDRAVLFLGHQFSDRISFFSELEVENALVAGPGSDDFHPGNEGDISMEQAFLKFSLTPKQYIVAGLFTPRIGITNENHLPVNFNGVERPIVEQTIIPTTWREIGLGWYGSFSQIPINYSLAMVNGLNSALFEHGSGIGGGEGQGSKALANNLALTASVQYVWTYFRLQFSGYAGGTVGLSPRTADSLGLQSGGFGTPIYLGEGDLQYSENGISLKLLGACVSYPQAGRLNAAYSKNLASGMYGAYAELGYDWLYAKRGQSSLISFAHIEILDMNSSLPAFPKAIYDGTEKQTHVIAGFSYLPIPKIAIKADLRILHTGSQNPALAVNPPTSTLQYKRDNQILHIGIGYSF
jgi:hypothetical protein